jgi:acyl-CoA synthetase (NDP forming)
MAVFCGSVDRSGVLGMNSELAFEIGRLQIKKFIHENGGRDARVLFVPNRAEEICGKYFDRSSRRCEISINVVHEEKDLAAAVRNAMLNPTVLS